MKVAPPQAEPADYCVYEYQHVNPNAKKFQDNKLLFLLCEKEHKRIQYKKHIIIKHFHVNNLITSIKSHKKNHYVRGYTE